MEMKGSILLLMGLACGGNLRCAIKSDYADTKKICLEL